MNPTAPTYDAAMALAQNNTQTLAETNANNIPTIEESLPHDRSFADREPDELDIENDRRNREMDIASANDPDHVDYETEARNQSSSSSSTTVASAPMSRYRAMLLPRIQSNSLEENVNSNDADIIQMGNVVQNDFPNQQAIRKRSADQMQNSNQTLINVRDAVILVDLVNEELATKFYVQSQQPNFNLLISQVILPDALTMIRIRLRNSAFRSLVPHDEVLTWPKDNMTMREVAEIIMRIYSSEVKNFNKTIEQQMRELPFGYSIGDETIEESHIMNILKTVKNHFMGVELDSVTDAALAKELFKKLPKNTGMARLYTALTVQDIVTGPDTVMRACFRLKDTLSKVREAIQLANSYGPLQYTFFIDKSDREHSKGADHNNNKNNNNNNKKAKTNQHTDRPVVRCEVCNNYGHVTKNCSWAGHSMANNDSGPWEGSAASKIWSQVGHTHFKTNVNVPGHGIVDKPKDRFGHNIKLHQKVFDTSSNKGNNNYNNNNNNPRPNDDRANKTSSYTQSLNDVHNQRSESIQTVCSSITDSSQSEYLHVTVSLHEQATHPMPTATASTSRRSQAKATKARTRIKQTLPALLPTPLSVNALALVDSGALPGNFVTQRLLQQLNGSDRLRKADQPIQVCSGLDNHCIDSSEVIDIWVSFNENNIKHSFALTCRISLTGPIDLIIGRDSIKEHNLVDKLPRFFFDNIDKNTHVSSITDGDHHTHCDTYPCGCNTPATSAGHASGPYDGLPPLISVPLNHQGDSRTKRVHFDDTPLIDRPVLATPAVLIDTPSQTQGHVAAVLPQTEQLKEVVNIGADEVDDDNKDTFASFRAPATPTDEMSDEQFLSLAVIEGSDKLKESIKLILLKYKKVFSDKLHNKPADIPPFDLDVDKRKWEHHRNRGPVRVQTQLKQVEAEKQIREMLDAGIIEVSSASFYSQILIATKPGGFRFCIDFRNLNEATDPASWPIPNIEQMIIRIGAHEPTHFAILDLTQGYHQAALATAAKVFTAFITFAGVYQFKRLPFGPKRAPSYFQEMMATIVLAGLIYFVCEVYLDDIIIYGTGEKQFLHRLDTVLERLLHKNICVKLSKCKFGLSKVEYVGRTLSKEGISMSTKKINSVLDFPKPQVNTQLRSFLGLANYFRNFVPNHSNVVAPLNQMVDHSAKKQKALVWTPAGEEAFIKIRTLIADSPTLFFMDATAPIYLMTDASDYGIGGYLYQIVNNDKQLVSLVSKALTTTQLAWSTIQKEAYAIFFCCTYLDNLLRDRKFTILTDHQNLTFIKQASNPMIVRWHLALQELDFNIEFVKGVDNVIADAMSRLCINNKPSLTNSTVMSAIMGPYRVDPIHWKNIKLVHNAQSGHGGVNRTLIKLQKDLKLTWKNMKLDVKEFIKKCVCCQKMSQIKIPITAYKYTTSSYTTMECINIDFIGPYPDKGYVLNIIDCFTRWVDLYPVTEATAESACRCLLHHFGRYGAPKVIRSDRGSHFANNVIEQFCAATSTLQNLTLAYSSQENAIVERNNKEINRHLRALTFDKNTIDDYQLSLPFVQRIINSSYNERTKISASDLLYGNAIDLSGNIYGSKEEILANTQTLTESSSKMLKMQSTLTRIAADILKKSDDEHNALNSSSVTEFAVSSYVLVRQRTTPATRLHTLWRGPMQVISHSQGEYTLLDLTTNKEKQYHSSQMKQFIFDPDETNPQDVSRRDYLEFFIEEIITHSGNTKKLSTLTFKVKWLGYDDSHISWEPWSNLREMEATHLYLIQQNLRHLIPKQFQENYPQ